MTFGVDMATLAEELIAEFSTEIGMSTVKHRTADAYDRVSGAHVPTWTDYAVLIAFDEIESEEATSDSYIRKQQLAIIAGHDIAVAPAEGDYIVKPSGSSHRVVMVVTDQYSAAYFCHIKRRPE